MRRIGRLLLIVLALAGAAACVMLAWLASQGVSARPGKSVSINVDDRTKVMHGSMTMKVSDIKVGERVVVTAMEKKSSDGKAILTASEIRLGTPAAKAKK